MLPTTSAVCSSPSQPDSAACVGGEFHLWNGTAARLAVVLLLAWAATSDATAAASIAPVSGPRPGASVDGGDPQTRRRAALAMDCLLRASARHNNINMRTSIKVRTIITSAKPYTLHACPSSHYLQRHGVHAARVPYSRAAC
eukprot:scaffold41331_cov65-Phaeocystis_antarctica.AAC.4